MPKYIEKVEKLTLPVIPLRGIVAFPSIPLNFELEREISKNRIKLRRQKVDLIVNR